MIPRCFFNTTCTVWPKGWAKVKAENFNGPNFELKVLIFALIIWSFALIIDFKPKHFFLLKTWTVRT